MNDNTYGTRYARSLRIPREHFSADLAAAVGNDFAILEAAKAADILPHGEFFYRAEHDYGCPRMTGLPCTCDPDITIFVIPADVLRDSEPLDGGKQDAK